MLLHRPHQVVRRASLAIMGLVSCAGLPSARADEYPNPGNANEFKPEPIGHKSFVRDSQGRIALVDGYPVQGAPPQIGYDQALRASAYGAFDVLMQQCFGGGFRDDIAAVGLPRYTFGSASRWDQVAWSQDGGGFAPPAGDRRVDNWSRAWRESAHRRLASNVRDHFLATINGVAVPAIGKDQFYAGSEIPQYRSPGAFGMVGANDMRVVGDPAAAGGNRYVIMVCWDGDDERHGINLARFYQTLTAMYAIPAARIAVLHPAGAGALLGPYVNTRPDGMGGFNPFPVDPTFLGENPNFVAVPVDAGNTRATFKSALDGAYFNNGAGAQITGNDSVLIFNTGHGGHTFVIQPGIIGDWDNNGLNNDVRYIIPDAGSGFYRGQAPLGSPSQYGTAGSARNIQGNGAEHYDVQLSFLRNLNIPANNAIEVQIDGVAFNPARVSGHPAGANERPLDPLVVAALDHFYFPDLDNADRVNNHATDTVIDFLHCAGATLSPFVLSAAVFDGGDQQAVGIVARPQKRRFNFNGAAVQIVDGTGTAGCGNAAIAEITITDNFVVHSADASFFIQHSYQGDLVVTLEKVGGPSVVLINRPNVPQTTFGFAADNYGAAAATLFNSTDEGATIYDVPAVTNPGIDNVSGDWLSENPLAAFVGQNAAGTWRLRVQDCAAGDTGTIQAFSLFLGLPADPACYPNCDGSTTQPCLNVLDFACFVNRYAAGESYANCDGSSFPPVLNVLDFACFLNRFAAGCSGC